MMTMSEAKRAGLVVMGEYGLPGSSCAALAYLPADAEQAAQEWADLDDDGEAIRRDATNRRNQRWALRMVCED